MPRKPKVNYSFELDALGMAIIHEETCTYRMSRQSIENALANLKANQRAYCDTGLYEEMHGLYIAALGFLEKKGTKS